MPFQQPRQQRLTHTQDLEIQTNMAPTRSIVRAPASTTVLPAFFIFSIHPALDIFDFRLLLDEQDAHKKDLGGDGGGSSMEYSSSSSSSTTRWEAFQEDMQKKNVGRRVKEAGLAAACAHRLVSLLRGLHGCWVGSRLGDGSSAPPLRGVPL